MIKWADFLISEATYDNDHLISTAIRHKESLTGIGKGIPIDRLSIASDIKNELCYYTIYNAKNSWKKGNKIHIFYVAGNPYLRIDENKVKLDYLGDLPEVSIKKEFIQSQPLPESPRGSLPKEPPTQIQEEEEEEATPEQLARLEQLEKQLQELESQPLPESPRGSLPKEPPTQIQEEEEEATPEQLNEIKRQLDELEYYLLSSPLPSSQQQQEATPEQLNEIKRQLDELENVLVKKNSIIANQINSSPELKIKKLKPKILHREDSSNDYKILRTLQKQNKKLDKIEQKLREKNYENSSAYKIPIEAYCVKCKIKRKIINVEKIIMKNGRPAIKGNCSICSCKVFRFVKN